MATDWQQRLIDEKIALDHRREKLCAFCSGDAYQELDEPQRALLTRQYILMTEYSEVLAARIARFSMRQPL